MQRRPRQRDKQHLQFVASLPCVVCATNVGVQVHHIKMADGRIMKPQSSNIAMKSDDRYTLPLCLRHHEELHATGERKFWGLYKHDAPLLALFVYSSSVRGDHEEAERMIILASYSLRALRA
jgi:hypothetical protein